MAKLKSFTASTGISFKDSKENWYKIGCALEVELEEGDNFEDVKKKTWNTVHVECEKQINEIMRK